MADLRGAITGAGACAGAAPAGRLVAVVVTHNRADKLDITLERLLAEPIALLSAVIVVDNASSDATPDVVGRHGARSDRVVSHRSAVNLGGAGGFALGLRMAAERFAPDWVVVMDDDARPAPGALAAFHAATDGEWDAIAAAVYEPSGAICEMNRPSRNPFWSVRGFLTLVSHVLRGRGRDGFHIPRAAYRAARPLAIDAASFVGLFLSRRALDLAGYPDARLFIYGDDVLYTLALSERGGRICFHPAIRFEHDFTTITAKGRRFVPLWKSYYHHRNLLIVYRRSAGWLFWPALLVVLPKWLMKVRHHRGERRAYLRLLGRAVADGLGNRLDATLAEIEVAARSGPPGQV
jgi:GT2 family glycosyltransferase